MYVLVRLDSGIYGMIPSNREIECNRLAKTQDLTQMHINPKASRDFSMIFRRAPLIIALLLIACLGWACAKAPASNSSYDYAGQFQVDPVFRAYYNYHGGRGATGKGDLPAAQGRQRYHPIPRNR